MFRAYYRKAVTERDGVAHGRDEHVDDGPLLVGAELLERDDSDGHRRDEQDEDDGQRNGAVLGEAALEELRVEIFTDAGTHLEAAEVSTSRLPRVPRDRSELFWSLCPRPVAQLFVSPQYNKMFPRMNFVVVEIQIDYFRCFSESVAPAGNQSC